MTELWQHQIDAQQFLDDGHFLLAFDPGTGKTLTALTAIKRIGGCHLAIVPSNVVTQWERAAIAAGLSVSVCRASKEADTKLTRDTHLTITTYKLAASKIVWLHLMKRVWQSLTLDESHMVKNPRAAMSQAIWGRRQVDRSLHTRCLRVWGLTGTPITRDPSDLWLYFSRCHPTLVLDKHITKLDDWVNYFCLYYDTPYGRKVYGTKREDELNAMLKNTSMRVKDSDTKRPRLVIDNLYVEPKKIDLSVLTDEARECMEELLVLLDGNATDEDLAKAEVMLSTLRRLIGEAKAPAVAEMVELELSSRGKIVVFYTHVSVGQTIEWSLRKKGVEVVRIGGDVPMQKRDDIKDKFIRDPKVKVFLGQMQATGTGMDGLQVADRVIVAEPAWTPGPNIQAFRRVARGGSKHRHVHASYAVMEKSIDEKVLEVVARRQASIDKIFQEETQP